MADEIVTEPVVAETAAPEPATETPAGEAVVQPDAQQTEAAQDFQPAAWQDQLPESWRSEIEGLGSLDEALNAMKRGMNYQPALSADDLMTTPPEGVEVDQTMNQAFRDLGVKIGLTKAQAQALVDFEVNQFRQAEQSAIEDASAQLRKQWGPQYEAKAAKANETMLKLDARMGNRLSAALGDGGLKASPELIEAFSLIGSMISEDTLAGSSMGGSGQMAPETAEGMFRSLFGGM